MAALHPLHVQMNDHSRAGADTLRRCGHSSAHAERNHVSGRVSLLPLVRDRASLAFSSSGLAQPYPFNARFGLGWQARGNLARFGIHPKSLSSVASLDGSKTIGKLLDNGKILFAKKQKLHD